MLNFCECAQDGYCQRYGKEMGGRMREICAGINCDLGTSAVFREQLLREREEIITSNTLPIPILLKTDQAPGDAVAMTAAIYSLHTAHPGKYITAVQSSYPEIFAHNPHVVPQGGQGNWLELQCHYPAIHQSNKRAIHFMQGWCEFLGMALGINVPLLTNRPHLYFPDDDPDVENFWLICSGGKNDLTNKLWSHHNYQEVIDILGEEVKFVQVGANSEEHPRLYGTSANMVNVTSLRGLFDLCRRARGVLCGVSLLMHVAAALEKPAIVIAGGREPVAWNAYPKQQYVHTVGMLQCSSTQGDIGGACWRSRVLPQGDNSALDKDTCEKPVNGLPQCMRMISPEHVADLVEKYNKQYGD